MATLFNAQTPTQAVREASMLGWKWIHAGILAAYAEFDCDYVNGLRCAQELGIEVRGYIPQHIWRQFIGNNPRSAGF